MSKRDIYDVLLILLIVTVLVCTFAQLASTAPITGSQVVTLEAGPDGIWLGQAYVVSLQLRADTWFQVVYDTWRQDGILTYRQWDLSIAKAWAPIKQLPISVTLGARWRPPLSHGHSYGGSGPWVYSMLQLEF